MKKYKHYFNFTLLIFFLGVLGVLILLSPELWRPTIHNVCKLGALLILAWGCGMFYLRRNKGNLSKPLVRILKAGNLICFGLLLSFFGIFLLMLQHPYRGGFEVDSTLFDQKNVMIIIPHQDDDINLAGGLIEQYTEAGSDVRVVFSTNGDRYAESEIRAEEAVEVLTTLGVKKENIYYLGFGDKWLPQTIDDVEIQHVYNSPDSDLVWTSYFGATETYSTKTIPCYQELPYTRSNYLHSMQSIIAQNMPDTIFAVDYDDHIDHRATDLLFEEALCNILTLYPDYHPTVYKGFCYGTAWKAVDDYFDSLNLYSAKQPDEKTWSLSAFGYAWEERVRFPMSKTNLNPVLLCNSVSVSMDQYSSQNAFLQSSRVLNSDKVFWERRTDSLLYGAQIFVDDQETALLNNFKLKEFHDISTLDCSNSGFVPLQGKTVTVRPEKAITINSINLYDNPAADANILSGYIAFSDGSRLDFSELDADGSPTTLTFPAKQVAWMEIVATNVDSETAGLSEIEAFFDDSAKPVKEDTYLMAIDQDDNFVCDYRLHETDRVSMTIHRFPDGTPLSKDEISLSFDSDDNGASYHWEDNVLTVVCEKGADCAITVSDAVSSTTFTVSNPAQAEYAYLQVLRFVDRTVLNIRYLFLIIDQLIEFVLTEYLSIG